MNFKQENVATANVLQLEAAGATPAPSRFNYNAMPSLRSLNTELSIRRVWPTGPLAQSAYAVLWRHNSARKDAMFVRGVVWHDVDSIEY